MKNNNQLMSFKLKTILLFLILSLKIFASESTIVVKDPIKGKVVSKTDGLPMPGATIVLKGTSISTISDLEGNFTITAPDANNAILIISYTGYKTQEVSVKGKSSLTVFLVETSTSLEEVVVVGYGTQKKGDLTGAIKKVKSEDLNVGSANLNAASMLEGRVAGVYINQHSGDPGADPVINIRGNGTLNVAKAERPNNANANPLYNPLIGSSADPLVIVDGFQLSHLRDMNSISPNDIESQTILMDASATAIYGARGANGVILITTKNGKKHTKNSFNYFSQLGVNTIVEELPVLNASQYLNFYKQLQDTPGFNLGNKSLNLSQEEIDKIVASGVNTNWQKELLAKPSRLNQSHFLTMTGGTENIKYTISGNYFTNHTIVAPGDFKRYNGKTRLGYDKGKLAVDVSLSYNNERNDRSRTIYNSFSRGDNEQDKFSYYNAILADPSQAVFNSDGSFTETRFDPTQFRSHPLFEPSVTTSFWIQRTTYIGANIKYEIVPGLKINTVYGGSKVNYESFRNVRAEWNNSNINYNENFASAVYRSTGDTNLDLFADYNLKANKHNLTALVGTQRVEKNYNDLEAAGYNFLNSEIGFNSLQSATLVGIPVTSRFKSTSLSYFGRLNYNYAEKYLVQFNLRADGASQFGVDNKYGYFPSASIGWKINKESFMKGFSKLWELKLRMSYGTAGNDNIPVGLTRLVYKYQPYSNTTTLQLNADFVPRSDLQWETISTANLGLDLGYKNLTATLDMYIKSSKDLLLTKNVPLETGFSSIILNQGEVENKGIELTLGYKFYNLFGTKLNYNTNFNFSYNQNKIVDLKGDRIVEGGVFIGNNLRGYTIERKEGYQFNSFFLYHFDGIWQTSEVEQAKVYGALPGDPKLRDVNGDKVLNDKDKYHAGNADPTVNLGFTNNFYYKNFTLRTFVQGVFGKHVYNQNRLVLENPSLGYLNNLSTDVLDRWTETNPSNSQSSKLRPIAITEVESDKYLDDASFVRLKDVNLTYNLKMSPKNTIKDLTFGVGVTNVITISPYKGLNPEVWRADNQWNINPYTRTVTFSLNANF